MNQVSEKSSIAAAALIVRLWPQILAPPRGEEIPSFLDTLYSDTYVAGFENFHPQSQAEVLLLKMIHYINKNI